MTAMTGSVIDDKSEHCIPFILSRLSAHRARHGAHPPPFFVGVNGIQGAGKTTLVDAINATLTSPQHGLTTAILSIDDLYLPHPAQQQLAASHPDNPLVQHRGQPGTHDVALGQAVFEALQAREPVRIPAYDKGAYNGEGDRTDSASWRQVNGPGQASVDVVIFEGWCVGFRPLPGEELKSKWQQAVAMVQDGNQTGQLGRQTLASVKFVNGRLVEYDSISDMLDAFIHIDAREPGWVYEWRLEQERKLREQRATGMDDEQVIRFVNGYYPAYELYTDQLRAGVFSTGPNQSGRQLRIVVGRDRKVEEVILI